MAKSNKFIIGIGSQRAGSTLLHRIISDCTQVFTHPIKELHYYDTLFNVRKDEFLKKFVMNELKGLIMNMVAEKEDYVVNKLMKCHLRSATLLATRNVKDIEYTDLYRPFLMGQKYLGEVTPEYMILPDDGVKKMSEDLGRDTKIILISRDPVERFLSSFKLLKMYGGKKYDIKDFSDDIRWTLENMPTWIQQQDELNDYETSLSRYRKYFDNVLFISFERMIAEPDGLYPLLSDFLEMDIDKERFTACFGQKVNQIGESGGVEPDLYEALTERFASSTKFLKEMKHL